MATKTAARASVESNRNDEDEPESIPAPGVKRHHFLDPRRATGRLFVATAVGIVATCFAPVHLDWRIRAVLGWDTGALCLLVLAWNILVRSCPNETQKRAGAEDPGRNLIWAVTVLASLFSLFAAVFVLRKVRAWTGFEGQLWTGLALLAVVLSWLVTHTLYTFRYAHLYYRGGRADGLDFPKDQKPADIDFAYFAFTIGMCFQVSDVVVSCTRVRRAVLVHSLISFVYNTTILSLALNVAFNLLGDG